MSKGIPRKGQHSVKRRAIAAVCLAACMVSACGVSQVRTIGKEQARRFHEQYNASQYDSIYNTSSPEFRSSVTHHSLAQR